MPPPPKRKKARLQSIKKAQEMVKLKRLLRQQEVEGKTEETCFGGEHKEDDSVKEEAAGEVVGASDLENLYCNETMDQVEEDVEGAPTTAGSGDRSSQMLEPVETPRMEWLNPGPLFMQRKRQKEADQCLLCCGENGDNRISSKSEKEEHFVVMFILRKMLSVPTEKLVKYLQQVGNPQEWISVCAQCSGLVEEAVKIQKEIGRLEGRLRRCQEGMIRKIWNSWKEEENEKITSVKLLIAQETRKLVVTSKKKLTPMTPSKAGNTKGLVGKILANVEVPQVLVVENRPNQVALPPACEPRTEVPRQKKNGGDDSNKFKRRTPSSTGNKIRVGRKQALQLRKGAEEVPIPVTPFPKPCELGKRVPRQETYGGDDDLDFYFDGAETSPPSPVESLSGQPEIPLSEIPGTHKILIDATEAEALNAGAFRCELCPNLPAMSANKLANHLSFHYKRPLKCPQCNVYHSNNDDLTSRQSIKRFGDGPHHVCNFIDLTSVQYPPPTSLLWRCHCCSQMFPTHTERDLHEKSRYPYDLGSLPRKRYKCSACVTSAFRNLAEWRLHRVLEHPSIDAVSCYYCDLTFKSKTKDGTEFFDEVAMIGHAEREHKRGIITLNSLLRLPIECLLCGATFPSAGGEGGLNDHMTAVHGVSKNQSFACPVCPVKKWKRSSIPHHLMASHMATDEESFICDLCAFTASNLMGLERHKFSEHGIVPESRPVFQCSKEGCSFQCLEKRKLDRHLMKEHGAERKHKCRYCGKGFLNAKHCWEHEKIHENASLKPYQCEICGNSFAVKNYLYIHKRLSHQNRPFASTHKKKPPRKKKTTPTSPPKLEVPSTANLTLEEERPLLHSSEIPPSNNPPLFEGIAQNVNDFSANYNYSLTPL